MHYVYVLRSLKNQKRYIGFTSKNSLDRLREHNKGTNVWARQNRPFELMHTEEYNTKQEARKREIFLKSSKGRKELNKILCARSSIG